MRRLIDPTAQADRHVTQRLGMTPQSEITNAINDTARDAGDGGHALYDPTGRLIDPNATEVAFAGSTVTVTRNGKRSTVTVSAAAKTDNLSVFAATTSAQLAGVLSDETGTGAAVFAGSPTLTGTVTAAAITASGTVTANGDVNIGDAQTDTLTITSHIAVAGADPTITNTPVGTYPGAGTTPGASTIVGNDTAMTISFSTGTTPAVGKIFTVNFATARPAATYGVWVSAHSSAAAPLLVYTTSRTTSGFDVQCVTTAPAASSALTFSILVIDL